MESLQRANNKKYNGSKIRKISFGRPANYCKCSLFGWTVVGLVLDFRYFRVYFYCISKLKFWNKKYCVLSKLVMGEPLIGKTFSALTGIVHLVEHLILASLHLYSCLGMHGKYLMFFPLFSADSVCNKAGSLQVVLQYQSLCCPKSVWFLLIYKLK